MAFSRRKAWEQERMTLAVTVALLGTLGSAPTRASTPMKIGGHRWLEAPALLAAMGVVLQ